MQPFVRLKSAAFAPPSTTEVMCSAPPPVFVTVTACGELAAPCAIVPKPKVAVDNVTSGFVGGAGVAVPFTGITCGELAASSVTVTAAERCPAASGVNVKVNVQLEPGLYAPLHVGVMAKSAALLPPSVTAVMCRGPLPVLVTLAAMGLLVVPWAIVGKFTGFGATVTAGAGGGGATPVPLSATDCGLSGALSVMTTVACCAPVPVDVGAKATLMEQNFVGWRTAGTWQVSLS